MRPRTCGGDEDNETGASGAQSYPLRVIRFGRSLAGGEGVNKLKYAKSLPHSLEKCKHSPPLQSRVMYGSAKISLMSSFIAGSSNLHPAPDLQLNVAGPLISSFKKSSMSSKRGQ